MEQVKKHTVGWYVFFSLLLCGCIIFTGFWTYRFQVESRKASAEKIVQYEVEQLRVLMESRLNYAYPLSVLASAGTLNTELFEDAAQQMLKTHSEIRYICLFEGNILRSVLPKDVFAEDEGKSLRDFSFAFSLAKQNNTFVVEGPDILHNTGASVFFFFQPISRDGQVWGEVGVAVDAAYVADQLGLQGLTQQGFDYELWHVDLQDGGKKVVAVSDDSVDFSYSVRHSVNLPAQWILGIYPRGGWVSQKELALLILGCILSAMLLLGILSLGCKNIQYKRRRETALRMDREMLIWNRRGFIEKLDAQLQYGSVPAILVYFVIRDFSRINQLVSQPDLEEFLLKTAETLDRYPISEHIVGRVGEGCFAVAIFEEMTQQESEDFAKGLALEIFWRIRIGEEKVFLNTGYQSVYFPQDGRSAEALLCRSAQLYFGKIMQESPVHVLTENCRKLFRGERNVTFGDYTDAAMTALSKAIHQYHKRTEQMAYDDPVMGIGNRLRYLRDARLLISYDDKRPFSLYCIDICSFGRFNELFSVETGDAVLREAVCRLAKVFGNYLYRIDGDVFIGLFWGEDLSEEAVATDLHSILYQQVGIGDLRFKLKAKIGICSYPLHACTPEKLLEWVQVALRQAKQSEHRDTVVYNDALTEVLRRETHILQLLEQSLADQTLEVWYQPIANLDTNTFNVAEALLRLKDEDGIYLPTIEVIAIAERNRMMDRVGSYVLRKACLAAKRLDTCDGFSRMAVNLSVQQLMVEGCMGDILSLLDEIGVNSTRISLEITESVLIQSFEQTDEILLQLQQAGIHIVLDDFGVGYSSLHYLSNLPVDVLKIDRRLTKQVLDSPKQYAMLKAIVEMAKINGIEVVVEGVETAEERDCIAQTGVRLIQGYYYARPMPEDAALAAIRRRDISGEE